MSTRQAEELIDKSFGLLGEMHDDLLEHKCENVESYNQQITKLFEQSAALKRALLEHDKMAMKGMKIDPPPKDNSQEPLYRYDAAAQYLADHGREIFTGHMIGGLWNGRCMDARIMSKKQGDKAAYDFMLKFGDQYASNLSVDLQRQWQNIKNQAAGILKDSREKTCGI